MKKEQIEAFLLDRGWGTWYNQNYWVHEKTIADPQCQDYTNYGMDLLSAYAFESLCLPPFQPMGLAFLSQTKQGLENRTRIEAFLKQCPKFS